MFTGTNSLEDAIEINLTNLDLPEGWVRKEISNHSPAIEARDGAAELAIPLNVTGRYDLTLTFFTYAHMENSSMQLKLTSQDLWRRVRPFRFIEQDRDALQTTVVLTLDIKDGDALLMRTQPVDYIVLAGVALTPVAKSTPIPREKHAAFVHDTNMSFSKFRIEQPEDVYSVFEPYVDSHVNHIFFGTGVGTYSPLYDSSTFGWHGEEQKTFMADHRERTAGVMRMLMEAGKDPLAMAVEYARAHDIKLWANHRISKNHPGDFADDYPGGRFLIEHRDKMVLDHTGEPHFQTIMSHAYPEIRATTVKCLIEQARYGVDGLYIDILRKSPIVGWERPVVKDFEREHGYDPRDASKRDSGFSDKWYRQLCKYPTMLFRELREALKPVEQQLGRRMPVAVTFKGDWRLNSGIPSAMTDGCDPLTWAREGLVDILIPAEASNLWIEQQCLDRFIHNLQGTNCEIWGAIGPQVRSCHRSKTEKAAYDTHYADLDPWRYLQAAHDFYSQGVPGVTLWEAQDVPCVPQVWNVLKDRIGSHSELCKVFGDKLGRYDGSDKFDRRFV